MCGRRKARLAEHFEVQSNVRILYTRYFVPVRCTENENFYILYYFFSLGYAILYLNNIYLTELGQVRPARVL